MTIKPSLATSTRTVYGIVGFEEAIACARDVLGHREVISIGGVQGTIEFPALPEWSPTESDPLSMPLVPPQTAKDWKRGSEPFWWGRPTRYPAGYANVTCVLLEFVVPDSELKSTGNQIRDAFMQWRSTFNDFLELITKQRRTRVVEVTGEVSGLHMFYWDADGKHAWAYDDNIHVTITTTPGDPYLNLAQLKQICSLCSSNVRPSLEYSLQLDAYRALRTADYRKAVIDSATAAEVVLTKAIVKRCNELGDDPEKCLKERKHRTLGGRLALARKLAISLPDIDLHQQVVEPRNDAIHEGKVMAKSTATQAVNAVDDLLALLNPSRS
ncbi:hypothetical protein B0G81_3971 [Paraburkholderia sp. BL6665CI2N2]|uniref:hypothetical protein n=1 Tax=Paraburkholderia sp. BL6665CI2N2 TaxID=1938806 RepID=UPI001065D8BA|nr:hypothetical protein [Paraburkholderia sp. BL6665CI2N2]TDY23588.1 hypothetical protein B0G81_3971 [Paraburkholderia sp. BL6665CI2N2]